MVLKEEAAVLQRRAVLLREVGADPTTNATTGTAPEVSDTHL